MAALLFSDQRGNTSLDWTIFVGYFFVTCHLDVAVHLIDCSYSCTIGANGDMTVMVPIAIGVNGCFPLANIGSIIMKPMDLVSSISMSQNRTCDCICSNISDDIGVFPFERRRPYLIV